MTRSITRPRAPRLAALALCAGAFILTSAVASAQSPDVAFVAASETPMITLTREHGMVRGVVDKPLVRVFGDGRVLVERPSYMRQAGAYEFKLSSDALAALVGDVAAIADLDVFRLDVRRNAADRANGVRFVTLDHTVTRIEMKFDGLGRRGDALRRVDRSLAVANVQIDAQRHADLRELADLARAERALLALAQMPLESKGSATVSKESSHD